MNAQDISLSVYIYPGYGRVMCVLWPSYGRVMGYVPLANVSILYRTDHVTLHCEVGAPRTSAATSATLNCQSDGQWTQGDAVVDCARPCHDPDGCHDPREDYCDPAMYPAYIMYEY